MGDAVELKEGVRPWEPPYLDEAPEILREFGIPLAGILRQSGTTYFFCCIAGEAARANLWTYVPIDEDEAEQARSWQVHVAALEAFTADDRRYVVAYHEEGSGIVRWETVDYPNKYDSPIAAAEVLGLQDEQFELLGSAYA